MRIAYAPGEWNIILRSGTLVVLPPDAGHDTISTIWEALAESQNLETAFRAVTKALGSDLTSMPPFAIASLRKRPHVMVRGQITIRSQRGNVETEVSGAHVTTWNEQVLDDPDALDIGFTGVPTGEAQLPLEAGVVRACRVAISLEDSASGKAGDKPEPTEAPADETPKPAAEEGPGAAPEDGTGQPSRGTSGDQTMSPTDLDEFEADDDGGAGLPETELSVVDEPRASGHAHGPSAESTARPDSGLIASVPWMDRSPDSPPAGPGAEALDSEAPDDTVRTQVSGEEVDHDGQTVMRSSLDVPVASGPPQDGPSQDGPSQDGTDAAPERGPSTAPIVLARICPSGHANPPTNSSCSTCGNAITSDPTQARRPSLGSMRMSNGEVVELDRSVVVGRQPSMSRVQGSVMPRMVQIRSEESDISRSHAEVQLEDWHVMLRDLNSTNGTFLVREGQPPRRLAQGEQTMLLDGDVAQLGDDVWLRFEELR